MEDRIWSGAAVRLGQGDYEQEYLAPVQSISAEEFAATIDKIPFVAEPAYQAARRTHLTSSALRDFVRCPELYRQKKIGLVPSEQTPALTVGTALHCALLEPDRFDREYKSDADAPKNPKTGKPYGSQTKATGQWREQMAVQGVTVLSESDYQWIYSVVPNVSIAIARLRMKCWHGEVTHRFGAHGVPCQVRFDAIGSRNDRVCIVDVKTTTDLDYFDPHAINRYGYMMQVGFYSLGARDLFGPQSAMDFVFVVVEKQAPYRVGCFAVAPNSIKDEIGVASAAVARPAKLRASTPETQAWPTGYEDIRWVGGAK